MTHLEAPLTDEQVLRYSRHLILPGFGGIAQDRLRSARVAIRGEGVGARVAALYLAAAGVGTLVLARREGRDEWEGESHPLSLSFISALNPEVTLEIPPSREDAAWVVDLESRPGGPPELEAPAGVLAGALAAAAVLVRLAEGSGGGRVNGDAPWGGWGLPPLEPGPAARPLAEARVVVVGAGGLGCPAALGLVLGGVRRLRVIDDDRVDLSNLQRQVLHRTADVGRHKVESVRDRVRALDPEVEVEAVVARLVPENAGELLGGADLVVEGSDNFDTKYLVNDSCARAGVPAVVAGALRFEAQVMVAAPGRGPCYRCVFPSAGGNVGQAACSRAGVLGPAVGAAGAVQALEALKVLRGVARPLVGALWLYSARDRFMRTVQARAVRSCPACGKAAGGVARS